MSDPTYWPRRAGHYMDLLDHFFNERGESLCHSYRSKAGGDKHNALKGERFKTALTRAGGRPLCFGCEKAMAGLPKAAT